MDDKEIIEIEGEHLIAQLILEQARYQSKCTRNDVQPDAFRVTPDAVREAANLVFLCLELIQDRKSHR